MRVAVIGSGILGAAAAWYLAQGGAAVTVFEADSSPGGRASAASFAWINASWGNPPPYRALRQAAMADWRDLGAAVPGAAPQRCGGLIWDLPAPDLRAFAAEARAQGYRLTEVDAAGAARIEPNLTRPPAFALHAPDEAALDAPAAARALIASAGATLVAGQAVRLDTAAGRVRIRGQAGFDAVVLAAGIATAGLLADLGLRLPVAGPAGMLAWTDPVPPRLNGLVLTPGLHLRQTPAGQIVIGADFAGAGATDDRAAAALVKVAGALIGLDLRLNRSSLAARPTPGDGFPAVGPIGPDGLHVLVSHSGVTLAPRLGRATAAMILSGTADPLLAPYAAARFRD